MHTGTTIQDLSESVDRALSPSPVPPQSAVHAEGEAEYAYVKDHLDAAMFIADAKMHVCSRVMELGDVQAWYLLDEVQTQLWRS